MAHHHKARTTSKKEIKRIEHKSSRQAEAQALRGDNVRTVRGFDWGHRLPQPPVIDAPSNGKRGAKKLRKPKERCPVNRTHEWYKEYHEAETEDFSWWNPEARWMIYERYTLWTCIHCWTSKKVGYKRRYRRVR